MNIPDYTLLQSCGKGAYGQVWLAQSQTNKLVALKYVANSQAGDREFEGLINYSQLPESPHLIRILHLGKLEDGFFYTMELADGLYSQGSYVPETLAERLKRTKRLPVTEVMDLATAMLSALGTLHEADMVHRDLKPENILYVNGTPKLSDVGLVRSSEQTVSLGGTLGFIPPERLKPGNSAAYNASDDLYALGKVLYCALTGNAVEKFPSVPPEMINNTLCCHLNQIILKACGNEEDRFKNTGDFLSQLQNGTDQTVKRELPYKKYIFPAVSAILLILLLLVVAKLIFTHSGTDQLQIADQLTAIQQLLQEQKNSPEKKSAEVAVQQTPAQKPPQQQEAAKNQSAPPLVKELEEHAKAKAVNLKTIHQHNPVLHHQPALKTALKHPDMGSVPRRMKKLFPTTQQEQTAETDVVSTTGKTLPPFVNTNDQKLFSHPLSDEFALRAKLTPNYNYFWNYTFHFAQKQNEKNIFSTDLAFLVTTMRGSIILLDNKDPNKNSLFSKALLYNYFPNIMERDILQTSLATGRSRVSGEHLTPASRKSYNRLINQRSFVLEIVKTKTSCSYYIDKILVATYPLKNQDFKNVFITQDLNKTNVLSEIELYDITPDPECPPEEAYVLPGHPARKPAPQKPLQNGSIDTMLDATLQQVLKP